MDFGHLLEICMCLLAIVGKTHSQARVPMSGVRQGSSLLQRSNLSPVFQSPGSPSRLRSSTSRRRTTIIRRRVIVNDPTNSIAPLRERAITPRRQRSRRISIQRNNRLTSMGPRAGRQLANLRRRTNSRFSPRQNSINLADPMQTGRRFAAPGITGLNVADPMQSGRNFGTQRLSGRNTADAMPAGRNTARVRQLIRNAARAVSRRQNGSLRNASPQSQNFGSSAPSQGRSSLGNSLTPLSSGLSHGRSSLGNSISPLSSGLSQGRSSLGDSIAPLSSGLSHGRSSLGNSIEPLSSGLSHEISPLGNSIAPLQGIQQGGIIIQMTTEEPWFET